MTLWTLIPIAVLVTVYGAIGMIVARRPLIARLALREVIRRPRQSGLLVLGMMFGTAAILGMQGVNDTFTTVNTHLIYSSWGRTDITVSQRGQLFSSDIASTLAADPHVGGLTAGVQGGFLLVGSAGDLDQRLSASPVQVSTFDGAQPGFGSFTLADGQTADLLNLGAQDAILNPILAKRLASKPGDRIQLTFIAGDKSYEASFGVAAITREGGAGFLDQQPGVLVQLSALQGVVGAGTVNVVRISAQGTGSQEVANARAIAPAVRAAVGALPGASALEVREVKAQDLDQNAVLANPTRGAFLLISLFVVLSATALVVNLALALAEERRPRLGVLRALGLSRSGLVLVSLVEGAVYSLVAALIGVLPGLAYTFYVDSRPIPGTTGQAVDPTLSLFTISPESISIAVCAGAVITLLTIFAVSIRTSRMAISSAVRDIPELPRGTSRSWFRIAVMLALTVLGIAASLPREPILHLFGGTALILAGSMLARGRLSERVRATLAGTAVVAWGVLNLVFSATLSLKIGEGFTLSFIVVAVSVFGAAVAISANLRLLELAVRLVSGRLVATLRPPLAYLTRRPVRAGLATGGFALILGALSFFAVLLPSIGPDPHASTSDFNVTVTALGNRAFTLPESLNSSVVRTDSLRTLAYVGPASMGKDGNWRSSFLQLYPLTRDQFGRPPVPLGTRDPQYSSDAAVWRAMRDDPTLVVATFSSRLGFISMVGSKGAVDRKIIGVAGSVVLGNQVSYGFLGNDQSFAELTASGDGTTILVKTAPGVDARAFALEVRRATFGSGVDAVAAVDTIDDYKSGNAWFVGFLTLLLQTAVVVGVLSLGILALRASIERRRTIGVLRALGYRPGQVLSGMLVEVAVTATVGIVVGIGIGLAVGFVFIASSGTTQGQLDVAQIVVPAIAIYAAVLMVTIGPALRASRLPTSEALRIIG